MRGIFTAGVLDAMAARGEPTFDVVIGVSSGAYCASSYLAGQHGRIRRIIENHMTGWNYANPYRMLIGRSLVDQDVLMDVTRRHDPLDVDALRSSQSRFEVVSTQASTGKPSYLPAGGSDCLCALHATVAIPYFYRGAPIRFRREDYFDGSVSDPLPFARAIEHGARSITVICANPPDDRPGPLPPVAKPFLRRALAQYPEVVEAIIKRHQSHAASYEMLAAPPRGVDVRVIDPPPGFLVTKFSRSREKVLKGYQIGYDAGLRG